MSVDDPIPIRTKKTNWKAIILEADPDFETTNRIIREYVFSGNDQNGGPRTFKGDYKKRGPYST